MSEGNGCAHSNTTMVREGRDSVIYCDACGAEMSRASNVYDDDD